MKRVLILSALLGASSAYASNESDVLSLPDLKVRFDSPARASADASLRLQSESAKKGQVWLLLSYEHFSGDKAGDEFGFTPTSILGYQRNFYPQGRVSNGMAYSLGIGLVGGGAAVYYHQGASSGVDFRVGLAVDVFFSSSFYGGAAVGVIPFLSWGIKV